MTEGKMTKEVAPGLYRENGEFVFNPVKVIAEGTRRGIEVVNEVASNRNSHFNEALIKKLHAAVLYYLPEVAGQYRLGEDVRVGGHRAIVGKELPLRMHQFGVWLEEETESLKERPEDILGALRLASEVHFGLVSPGLHPFFDGNGRVARLLGNAILMLNTHELMFYGVKILPVPLIRQSSFDKDPYVSILEEIDETRVLNPLDEYIASLWSKNIQQMIMAYKEKFPSNGRKKFVGDVKLLDKFQSRVAKLENFSVMGGDTHTVPDYFATRHVIME